MHAKPLLFIIGLVAFLSISMWTPLVIISTHPDNISYANSWPEMAVDPLGNTYVVWQGSDRNDKEIYWVRVDAEGTPGQVQKVSIHPDNIDTNDWRPQIAVDGSGNSYITWSGSDGNDSEVYWVKIDEKGIPSTIQKISTFKDDMEYNDSSPHIAVDSEGNTFVTWGGSDGTSTSIYWVKIDAEGVPCTVQKISNHPDNKTCCNYDPHIAIDTSGNSYVVWHGCDKEECWKEPGDLEIYWVKIDSEGLPGTVKKIPPTSPDNINIMAMEPQLAVDAQGTSYIVWSGMSEGSHSIYWVKIDTSGELGAVQEISADPDPEHNDCHPRIVLDFSGNLYVTWEGARGKYGDIYWVKINAEGTPGSVLKISEYLLSEDYADWYSHIAADSSGNSYVVWLRDNGKSAEQFDQRVCWVKIDTEGKPGKIHDISSRQRRHFDTDPRIAVDVHGNSYVVWIGVDASGHDHIYFTATLANPGLSATVFVMIAAVGLVVVIIAVIIRKKSRHVSSHSNRQNNSQVLQEK
jgi:hypothetical protein